MKIQTDPEVTSPSPALASLHTHSKKLTIIVTYIAANSSLAALNSCFLQVHLEDIVNKHRASRGLE